MARPPSASRAGTLFVVFVLLEERPGYCQNYQQLHDAEWIAHTVLARLGGPVPPLAVSLSARGSGCPRRGVSLKWSRAKGYASDALKQVQLVDQDVAALIVL